MTRTKLGLRPGRGLTRRGFLGTGVAAGLGATALSLPFVPRARASTPLTVVEWGTPWIEASRAINEGSDWTIKWVLHEGGSAAILPKIKGAWPNPVYDMVNVWTPVFLTMIREGWAETVTLDDVPNLANVPEDLITKDEKGNWKSIPRSLSGMFFAYRPDICPIEITTIEDLLSPELTGQISWPTPTLNTNLQTVNLALARGGSEHAMEPGWQFLAEIAKSGNIGRVANSSQDVLNSLTTGETSVSFIDQGTAASLADRVDVKFLAKTDPSLKTFLFTEGWVVLANSQNKEAAFEYANFTMDAERCEAYNAQIGEAPTNVGSQATDAVAHLSMSAEELKEYAYLVDYEAVSTAVDGANKRFEQDIVPLLN